jgi:hypothetical protein
MTDTFAVFGFDSTHDALRAENVLLAADEDVVLIPTPRALGSLCGFAVRVPLKQRGPALVHLMEAGLEPSAEIEMSDRVSR